MLAEFIVMFREALEVSFVIGIVLAYLHQTKKQEYEKHVHLGLGTGIVGSLILAYLFQFVQGGFEASEELYEGVFMILASALVTWLILWMMGQKEVVTRLKKEVQTKIDQKESMGLFLLVFVAVLREGIEAVLFMAGILVNTGGLSILGGLLGLVAAVVVGILIFEYSMKFNINLFFKATTVLLVLLAAGLFSQGIHELQEAKVIPTYIEHVYVINPPANPDGTYPLMHEKGAAGSILKGLFGYDGNPSEFQIAGYFAYLAAVYGIYRLKYSKG
ncbi:FTR1 family protein [Candidatus Micrarchaeota archaeon]|nr:FTR1 family protein [Candidatus Micrarchaeota archaeon]